MNSTHTTDSTLTLDTLRNSIKRPLKNSAHAPFTERLLKVSKKSLPKGLSLELKHSVEFHQNSIPILVSPKLLRSRQLGQIDLARMLRDHDGHKIEVAEVKSSKTGEEASLRSQRQRLMASTSYLASLFGVRIKLTTLIG